MPGAAPASLVTRPALGRWIFLLVPLLVLPVPFLVNRYIQYVLNLILVYVLVGVGFNIVIGNLGQLAFANVALFGLGAYASGILVVHAGWPWWTTVLPAGLVGALAGALASLPALRRIRLFYLAIMTMAFGELMRWIYIRAEPLDQRLDGPGGAASRCCSACACRATAASSTCSSRSRWSSSLLTSSLLRSRFGRAFMAIRDNELAAAAVGIPTDRYFVLAFAWSGFVVGLAGRHVHGAGRPRHAGGLQPARADPPLRHRDGRRAGEPRRLGDRRHRAHHDAGAVPELPRASRSWCSRS